MAFPGGAKVLFAIFDCGIPDQTHYFWKLLKQGISKSVNHGAFLDS